jgi:threonine dehydrogenase-like Zn-dependent dehydrogenase
MNAVMGIKQGELGLGEMPVPKLSEFEALVHMDACAICNSTDWKLIQNEFLPGTFPIVLGHEVVGTIVEIDKKVKNYRIGDRVFRQRLRDEHVPGEGRSCWGGMAEYAIVVDEWAKQDLPYDPKVLSHDQQKLILNINPPEATAMVTLMETLDCVMNCGVSPNRSVAVVGSGPVGQCFSRFAVLLGASPVFSFGRSERNRERFANVVHCDGYIAAKSYPTDVKKILSNGGFDIVIEAVGSSEALEHAVLLAGQRGSVYIYGLAPLSNPYSESILTRKNVYVVGAVEGRVQELVVKYIESEEIKLSDWITHVFSIIDYQRAFDLVHSRKAIKCVLSNT